MTFSLVLVTGISGFHILLVGGLFCCTFCCFGLLRLVWLAAQIQTYTSTVFNCLVLTRHFAWRNLESHIPFAQYCIASSMHCLLYGVVDVCCSVCVCEYAYIYIYIEQTSTTSYIYTHIFIHTYIC